MGFGWTPDERFVGARANVFKPFPRVGLVFDLTAFNALLAYCDHHITVVGFPLVKVMPRFRGSSRHSGSSP